MNHIGVHIATINRCFLTNLGGTPLPEMKFELKKISENDRIANNKNGFYFYVYTAGHGTKRCVYVLKIIHRHERWESELPPKVPFTVIKTFDNIEDHKEYNPIHYSGFNFDNEVEKVYWDGNWETPSVNTYKKEEPEIVSYPLNCNAYDITFKIDSGFIIIDEDKTSSIFLEK